MRNKIGNVLIRLGAAALLAAAGLMLFNRREESAAAAAVEAALPQVLEEIRQQQETGPLPDPYSEEMREVSIGEENYIGYLSVPVLGLDLPVMAEWSYPLLKKAPCRYTGATKTDDLVVMAHNYARHFGTIDTLSAGDEVIFTDMEGVITRYTVTALDVLDASAVEEMTAGEYDLTLFTCTYGGQSRVTVRCDKDA